MAPRSPCAVLSPQLKAVAENIRAIFSAKPFDPPARHAIEENGGTPELLRFLIDSGEVIEVGPDIILLRDNFERMKSTTVEFISKNGRATVSQLREALQSSRRVMVPFLEYLDHTSVTARV